MDTDFKVWVGIVYALSNKRLSHDGQLELNFPEFAKYCGIESKRIDRQLKDRFDASLTRIARTNISFIKQIPGTDDHITINMHLVESTYYDSCKRTARAVLTVMCYSVGSAMRQGSSLNRHG